MIASTPKPATRRLPAVVGLFLILALGIQAAGCATKNVEKEIPPAFFEPPTVADNKVIIEPGDELTIRFYYHPEFDSTQIVRSDGRVSLTLFQGIMASGQTPEEFQAILVDSYSKEFVDPVITVEINKAANNAVYVTGEVRQGGMKQIKHNMTVGTLLAQCAVNEVDGSISRVILVRKHSAKEYRAYEIDASFGGGKERDLYVKSGDILYVPRNGITLAGDFVQKYIRNIIPVDMLLTVGDLGMTIH